MAFTKVFGSTDGAWSTATLWLPISVRNANYSWTASGSGTNEYYLRTAVNANPGFAAQPDNVFLNGVDAGAAGTLGSLAAGKWGYGNNDTLGYNTLYVRTSGGVDPDTLARDYVQFYQTPRAGEDVRFDVNSGSINSATGLDQSAIALGALIFMKGWLGTVGSATLGYLAANPTRFEFDGSSGGECWIDLVASAIAAQIYGTAQAADGAFGLYLKGSALTTVNMMSGNVGLAVNGGETSTVTNIRLVGSDANVTLGNGVTVTNFQQFGGTAFIRCGVTTTTIYDGEHETAENGAMTTVNLYGGKYVWLSSGTITTFNIHGGEFDMKQSGAARTLTTFNKYRGSYTILRNKEAVTITTESPQDSYLESVSA